MFGLRQLFLLPLLALALGGCEATNLFVSHNTVVGLDAAVNSEKTSGHLFFGYDRNSVTIIPVSVDADLIKNIPAKGGGGSKPAIATQIHESGGSVTGKEAMSALSCSDVQVDGIFLTRFEESLATGNAAMLLSRNLKDKADVFPCLQGK